MDVVRSRPLLRHVRDECEKACAFDRFRKPVLVRETGAGALARDDFRVGRDEPPYCLYILIVNRLNAMLAEVAGAVWRGL